MSRVRIDLTMGQTTPVGDFMGKLMYSNNLLLSVINYTGCPHNGGEHSFCINDDVDSAIVWVELLIETITDTGGQYALTLQKTNAIKTLSGFLDYVKDTLTTTSKNSFSLKKYCFDNGIEL